MLSTCKASSNFVLKKIRRIEFGYFTVETALFYSNRPLSFRVRMSKKKYSYPLRCPFVCNRKYRFLGDSLDKDKQDMLFVATNLDGISTPTSPDDGKSNYSFDIQGISLNTTSLRPFSCKLLGKLWRHTAIRVKGYPNLR